MFLVLYDFIVKKKRSKLLRIDFDFCYLFYICKFSVYFVG